jgi:alkyl hydroperoxide reductase subunit AhpC
MPASLIVDADHTVRWIDVHPDYTTRSEPGQILAVLDALAAR